jgi:hypothetical protein
VMACLSRVPSSRPDLTDLASRFGQIVASLPIEEQEAPSRRVALPAGLVDAHGETAASPMAETQPVDGLES